MPQIHAINKVLGRNFVKKFGTSGALCFSAGLHRSTPVLSSALLPMLLWLEPLFAQRAALSSAQDRLRWPPHPYEAHLTPCAQS